MRAHALFFIAILLTAFVSGCVSEESRESQGQAGQAAQPEDNCTSDKEFCREPPAPPAPVGQPPITG